MSSLKQPSQVASYALRLVSMATGGAGLLFGFLATASFEGSRQPDSLINDWGAFAFVMLLPLIIGLVSIFARVRFIRFANAFYALGYLVILTIWATGISEVQRAHGDVWITSVIAIPASAAMAWAAENRARGLVAWGYLALISALSGIVTFQSSVSPERSIESFQMALYTFAFSAVYVAVCQVAIQGSARLDATRDAAAREREASLADAARADERVRIESLVHDGAISTLLVAGREGAPIEALAAQARDTLQQLSDRADDTSVSWQDFCDRLTRVRDQLVPSATLQVPTNLQLSLATAVADAFEGAASEALRNVSRHAIADADPGQVGCSLAVSVSEESGEVLIRVSDTGSGFDTDRVDDRRLGIRRSIIERMRAVGGDALVHSRSGVGTTVTLTWSPS